MRKRLVYRADDIGYTETFDEGAFAAFENGICTSADIMLDSPHTIEALIYFSKRPWVSVGWHRHLWESPVCDPKDVPSLVDEEGRFRWRHSHPEYMNDATYEDAFKEFSAEVELCLKYLGRVPDSARYSGNRPIDLAMRDVCLKYNINCNFWSEVSPGGNVVEADPQYQHLNFRRWIASDEVETNKKEKKGRFEIANYPLYDPAKIIMSVEWTDDSQIFRVGGHPGFLDDHILAESTCNIHRVKDYEAVTSPVVKQWIIDNHIELISQRDVVNGTNEFQDHLKEIDSPLWIGNMK